MSWSSACEEKDIASHIFAKSTFCTVSQCEALAKKAGYVYWVVSRWGHVGQTTVGQTNYPQAPDKLDGSINELWDKQATRQLDRTSPNL